jgi:hypothetical protein
MGKWLTFLLAVALALALHEGTHIATAQRYGEFETIHIQPFGIEVQFSTPVAERSGPRWAVISGSSNLLTIVLGYLLLGVSRRVAPVRSRAGRRVLFYLTLVLLLADPFNLSIGALIWGGDADGIAAGLGVHRSVVQGVALALLLVNRELAVARLLPAYGVPATHVLLRPWVRRRAGGPRSEPADLGY